VRIRKKHAEKHLDRVIDIAERTRVTAIPVDRKRFFAKRMLDKVREYPVIVRPDPGTVNIERPYHLDRHSVDIPESFAHRFTEPLGFVIAGPRSDHGNIPAVIFRRRHMLVIRIAINLAGTGKKKTFHLLFARELEHIPCADGPDIHGLDRELGVIDRRGDPRGMDQIIDLFIRLERFDHIVFLECQMIVRKDLLLVSGDEIVQEDRRKFLFQDFLIEVTEKQDDVIPKKTACSRHKEGLPFEMLELVLEVLGELDDVFLDDLRTVKPLMMRLCLGHVFPSFPGGMPISPKMSCDYSLIGVSHSNKNMGSSWKLSGNS